MLIAYFADYYSNPRGELFAVLYFSGGKFDYVYGPDTFWNSLKARTISGKGNKIYSVKDGEDFMRALPYAFSGISLRASLHEE